MQKHFLLQLLNGNLKQNVYSKYCTALVIKCYSKCKIIFSYSVNGDMKTRLELKILRDCINASPSTLTLTSK